MWGSSTAAHPAAGHGARAHTLTHVCGHIHTHTSNHTYTQADTYTHTHPYTLEHTHTSRYTWVAPLPHSCTPSVSPPASSWTEPRWPRCYCRCPCAAVWRGARSGRPRRRPSPQSCPPQTRGSAGGRARWGHRSVATTTECRGVLHKHTHSRTHTLTRAHSHAQTHRNSQHAHIHGKR